MSASVSPWRDAAIELVRRTTQAQGLPERVEDPVMLADLARMTLADSAKAVQKK